MEKPHKEGKNGENISRCEVFKGAEVSDQEKIALSDMRTLQGVLSEIRHVPSVLSRTRFERRDSRNSESVMVI